MSPSKTSKMPVSTSSLHSASGDSNFWLYFKIALCANLFSAILSVPNDCDETFNYLEPLHFITSPPRDGKTAFQTWEYSPSNGLRSYGYLWLIGWPSWLIHTLIGSCSSVAALLTVRCYLASFTAFACARLGSALDRNVSTKSSKSSNSPLIGLLFVLFQAGSAGNFSSASSTLPSATPSVGLVMLALAFFLDNQLFKAVGCVASIGILVWPFAALLGLPLALYMLLVPANRLHFLTSSCAWASILLCFTLAIDSLYYGRLTLAPLNILRYNVLSSLTASSSQLYGIEPASFYVKVYLLAVNLLLPVVLVFLVLALPYIAYTYLVGRSKSPVLDLVLSSGLPLLIWNLVFFLQAHKEERFLYPAFPLIAVLASLACHLLLTSRFGSNKQWLRSIVNGLVILLVTAFLLLSLSRIASQLRWYRGPHHLVRHLPTVAGTNQSRLCLGREWHQFPSRFILPQTDRWQIGLLRSAFKGQLPANFVPLSSTTSLLESTQADGGRFNTLNREEVDRYVEETQCDLILDRDSPVADDRERLYSADKVNWKVIATATGLDRQLCPTRLDALLARSFYVPMWSERVLSTLGCTMNYVLLASSRLN